MFSFLDMPINTSVLQEPFAALRSACLLYLVAVRGSLWPVHFLNFYYFRLFACHCLFSLETNFSESTLFLSSFLGSVFYSSPPFP